MSGRVTDKLSLIGTYAYTDAEITKDNSGNEGKGLIGAARHSGSLWAKYEVIPERFEVGAGGYLVGSRGGNIFGLDFEVPGYGRVDAFAAYRWKLGGSRLTAQLNLNNILDKEYFFASSSQSGSEVFPGEPLTVIGSLRIEY